MKLTDKSVAEFTEALASKEPVPGGGGAAAAAGALGAALCIMVGNYTVGKKKYAAVEEDVRQIMKEAASLQHELTELINLDAEAFEPLSRAYAVPKDDPKRDEILEEAAVNACRAPARMVHCCCRTIDLLDEMLDKGSVLLLSDVGCGALMCRAALESAALNVLINTGSMKDREKAGQMEQEIDTLLQKYVPAAQRIADQVSDRIRKKGS